MLFLYIYFFCFLFFCFLFCFVFWFFGFFLVTYFISQLTFSFFLLCIYAFDKLFDKFAITGTNAVVMHIGRHYTYQNVLKILQDIFEHGLKKYIFFSKK